MMIEAATRPIASLLLAPIQAIPERDQDERKRREVVAEAVTELDPALAEVHQVEHRDRDRGNRRAQHEPRGASR